MGECNGNTTLRRARVLEAVELLLRRAGLDDHALLLLLAGIVGLIAGGGVVLFRLAYEAITAAMVPGAHGHEVLAAIRERPWPWLVGGTALGGLAVGLLHRFAARRTEFHGVSEVIHAVAYRDGRLSPRNTVVRFLTNALSIGSGGSVGPEGPVIELGSGLGSASAQALGLSPERMRTLVGCGAAAGLSAAFNAPIAGAIFALEIVLKDFAVVTFSPIIVASVLSTVLSRMVLGSEPAFSVPGYELVSPYELVFYVGLGLLAGLWGTAFSHALRQSERVIGRVPIPRPLLPALGGLVLGVGLVFLPELYGVGYEPITGLLGGELAWTTIALLLVAKFLATNLTLGSGFAGGIFAPILFMGSAMGALVGKGVNAIMPAQSSVPGAYALVGMAALMAAVTHAPITAILLVFEMTGGYEVILPLMLSCIAAVAVAQALSRGSAFTLGLTERGFDVNYGRESAILRQYYVEDLMHTELPKVRLRTPFGEILDQFIEEREDRWYVVDDDDRLVGAIDLHDIKSVLQEQGLRWVVIAADVMHPVDRTVSRRENLEDVILVLRSGEDEVPVIVAPDDPRLVGRLTRGDVLDLYHREVLHKEVLGIKVTQRETNTMQTLDLPSEYAVELVPVGSTFAGRSLAELDLRGRFGVHVIALKRPGQRFAGRNELPDPHEALQRGDRLVVVGRKEDTARMRNEEEARDLPR
jgi:chloride channel protein, CIC family